MFITVLTDGQERLLNTAHIQWIRPYMVNDGETGVKVAQGCEVLMASNNQRYFIGNDYDQVSKLLNFNHLLIQPTYKPNQP